MSKNGRVRSDKGTEKRFESLLRELKSFRFTLEGTSERLEYDVRAIDNEMRYLTPQDTSRRTTCQRAKQLKEGAIGEIRECLQQVDELVAVIETESDLRGAGVRRFLEGDSLKKLDVALAEIQVNSERGQSISRGLRVTMARFFSGQT